MTTPIVQSITDEMVAELERIAKNHHYAPVDPDVLKALLAERKELVMDAERYRWLRDNWFQIYGESKGLDGIRISIGRIWNHAGIPDHVDAAIDAARGEV